jgi:hypothetical protein
MPFKPVSANQGETAEVVLSQDVTFISAIVR